MGSKRSPRLVPDTIEFGGQRPRGAEWTRGKVPWVCPEGQFGEAEVVVWDYPHGRAVRASSCTITASPTLPPEKYAWELFELLEGFVDAHLRPGWQIGRVDLSRDIVVPDCVEVLEAAARGLVWQGPCETYQRWPRSLGVVGFPEGLDRIRVYHKGAEVAKKRKTTRIPFLLRNVVRVEAQLRKAHIPEEVRCCPDGTQDARQGRSTVDRFRSERWRPDPSEDDPRPRLRPAMPGYVQRITDKWLVETGLTALVPQRSGNELAAWMPARKPDESGTVQRGREA